MAVLKSLLPSGLLATVVGAIVGAYAGAWAGGPIADALSPGGLEGLGQGVFIIVVSGATGSGLGAGLALRLTRKPRPLGTAILAPPAVFLSVVVADRLSPDGSPPAALQIGLTIAALWLARIVTMAWTRHPSDDLTGN
ncbi:MAG: hypothetical protein ACLFRT_08070 [Actinomycetota bacterium]